ncbi:MAG: hypothetical protein WKF57_06535 [Nakamurella sp.]
MDNPELTCPLPDCDGDLYLTFESDYVLSRNDLEFHDIGSRPTSASWKVTCTSMHVLLLPTYEDDDNDNSRFGQDEWARLIKLVGEQAPPQTPLPDQS